MSLDFTSRKKELLVRNGWAREGRDGVVKLTPAGESRLAGFAGQRLKLRERVILNAFHSMHEHNAAHSAPRPRLPRRRPKR